MSSSSKGINKGKIIEAATKALQKGNVSKAIKEYEKILKADPQDIRTMLKVSDLYARIGDVAQARELFEKVADFYKEQGFLLKALAVYKQIESRLAEDDPVVFMQLAELYEQLGLLNDAMQSYKSAAVLYKKQGKTKDWLDTVEKLLELEPDNVRARLRLAELFSDKGMVREAVKHYRKVAEVLKKAGARDDFVKVAQRLLYHQPDEFETNKDLAEAYLEQGDALKALIRLRACYKSKPQDSEVLDLIARTFEFLKQPHKAVAVLKELARVYAKFGLLRERDEVFSRILSLDPGDTSAKRALRVASLGEVSREQEVSFDQSGEAIEEFEGEDLPLEDEEGQLPPPPTEVSEPSAPVETAPQEEEEEEEESHTVLQSMDDFIKESGAENENEFEEPEHTLVQNMDDLIKELAKQENMEDTGFEQIEVVPSQLQGDIKELEFYIDTEMWDEAKILLAELEEKAPGLEALKRFRSMIDEAQ